MAQSALAMAKRAKQLSVGVWYGLAAFAALCLVFIGIMTLPWTGGWRRSILDSLGYSAAGGDAANQNAHPEWRQWAFSGRPDYHLPSQPEAPLPVLLKIPTSQPVVFLTIDDGVTKNRAGAKLMTEANFKPTLFLVDQFISKNYGYFRDLVRSGATIENHTADHTELRGLTYDQQKQEICNGADRLGSVFRKRPELFRPPNGAYDNATLQAAKDCGMKALVMWHAKANGGSVQYQDNNARLEAGDIVLMHFRPEMVRDLEAFVRAAQAAHLKVAHLEDWL